MLEDLDVRESADELHDLHDDESQLGASQTLDHEEQSDSDETFTEEASSMGDVSPLRPQRMVAYERYQVMEKRAVQVSEWNRLLLGPTDSVSVGYNYMLCSFCLTTKASRLNMNTT